MPVRTHALCLFERASPRRSIRQGVQRRQERVGALRRQGHACSRKADPRVHGCSKRRDTAQSGHLRAFCRRGPRSRRAPKTGHSGCHRRCIRRGRAPPRTLGSLSDYLRAAQTPLTVREATTAEAQPRSAGSLPKPACIRAVARERRRCMRPQRTYGLPDLGPRGGPNPRPRQDNQSARGYYRPLLALPGSSAPRSCPLENRAGRRSHPKAKSSARAASRGPRRRRSARIPRRLSAPVRD